MTPPFIRYNCNLRRKRTGCCIHGQSARPRHLNIVLLPDSAPAVCASRFRILFSKVCELFKLLFDKAQSSLASFFLLFLFLICKFPLSASIVCLIFQIPSLGSLYLCCFNKNYMDFQISIFLFFFQFFEMLFHGTFLLAQSGTVLLQSSTKFFFCIAYCFFLLFFSFLLFQIDHNRNTTMPLIMLV